MTTALQTAENAIEAAVREFGDGLGVISHLTDAQRRAITKRAGELAKQCMRIQCDMDQQLVRETLGA